MIDRAAPIIPWKGLGGIKLYSTIKELKDIVIDRDVKAVLLNNTWVRYEINNIAYLFFHLINGKLFKITTLEGYEGKLFDKIYVGMSEQDLIIEDPSFIFDEFEEIFESPKGVFLETNPVTHKVECISVYITEMDNEDFDEGMW